MNTGQSWLRSLEDQINSLQQEERKSTLKFSDKDKFYVIGKNQETIKISQFFQLTGIIDDAAHSGAHWNGIPLIKSEDANKNLCVINSSTSIRPVDTFHYLKQAGFTKIINLSSLAIKIGEMDLLPEFTKEQRDEIYQHCNEWEDIFNHLHDQESKNTFLDTLKFRLTADPKFMAHYKVRLQDQYFENFMRYQEESFVDAGGFDGDTAIEFAKRHPDYKNIMIFEPSEKNLTKARQRLADFRDITFFQIGLSNAYDRLRFSAEAGSASSVSEHGNEQITVDTLDSLIQGPITFIKMDLEGWEIPALQGASGHIKNTSPKLALATYHHPSDLRKIYKLIQSFGKNYDVFLRHYTQGWSETIMFFKPRI